MSDRLTVRLVGELQRRTAHEYVAAAPLGHFITIRPGSRSLDQNAKFHAMCAALGRSNLEWSGQCRAPAGWKVLLVSGHAVATDEPCDMVVGLEGELLNIRESTAGMSAARKSSLIEYGTAFCALHGVDQQRYRSLREFGRAMSEADHQAGLFRWARMQQAVMPALRWLYHCPNGGKRDKATAWKLKQQGVVAGVSDVHLPVARGGFHGLWIELKNDAPRGVVTPEQIDWLEGMQAEGHMTLVAYSWTEAAEAIVGYLRLGTVARPQPPPPNPQTERPRPRPAPPLAAA